MVRRIALMSLVLGLAGCAGGGMSPEGFGRRWRRASSAERSRLLAAVDTVFLKRCLMGKGVEQIRVYLGPPGSDAPLGERRTFTYSHDTGDLIIVFGPKGSVGSFFRVE